MARVRTMTMALATTGVLAAGATLLGQQFGPPGRAPAGGEAREARAERQVMTKVYAVADLLPGLANVGGDQSKVDMGPLIDLLAASVAPGTWRVPDEDGKSTRDGDGPGSIIPFRLSLSLIVKHTPEVHAQFDERLRQLRRAFAPVEVEARLDVPLALPPGGQDVPLALPPGGQPGTSAPAAAPAVPAAGMPGMPRMPGMRPVVAASAAPGGSAGGAPIAVPPGGIPAAPGQSEATSMRPGSALPAAGPPYAPGTASTPSQRAPGASTYDVNVDYPLESSQKRAARKDAARDDETERRLRSLEEKLDRVLKALDVPKSEPPRGTRGQ
jgi:hypothetical protein